MSATWTDDRPLPRRQRIVAIYTKAWVRAFLRGENPPDVIVDAESWRDSPPAESPARPAPTHCERSEPYYTRHGRLDWTDECGELLPCRLHDREPVAA